MIITLSIISVILLLICFFLGKGFVRLCQESSELINYCQELEMLADPLTHKPYPCKLFTTIYFNAPEDKVVVDMSQYEEKGIISHITYVTRNALDEEEREAHGRVFFHPQAAVWNLFDEMYAWEAWIGLWE